MLARTEPFPGPASQARLAGRLGLGAFALFVAVGVGVRVGPNPAAAVVGAVLAVGAALPLFGASGRPSLRLAAAVVASAGVVVLCTGDPGDVGWFALAIVAGWCVLWAGARVGLAFGVGCLVVLAVEEVWVVRDPGWISWTAGLVATVLFTLLVRHQLVLVQALRAAQADLAERSRAEERNRIAHELHDVIAHGLTVSLLHVTSARLAVEHDPADAARALAEAERLGRQCLAEVRATVGLLPSAGGVAPPVPGLDQLPQLVEQFRRAGVRGSLSVVGEMGPVPATVGATAYRIAQEAMTNAAKHAGHTEVTVSLAARDHSLELSIDSAGAPGRGSGMGLMGMEERARSVGGSLSAGPGGRGWLVRAVLPVHPVDPASGADPAPVEASGD